jgi:hypothetical protein
MAAFIVTVNFTKNDVATPTEGEQHTWLLWYCGAGKTGNVLLNVGKYDIGGTQGKDGTFVVEPDGSKLCYNDTHFAFVLALGSTRGEKGVRGGGVIKSSNALTLTPTYTGIISFGSIVNLGRQKVEVEL